MQFLRMSFQSCHISSVLCGFTDNHVNNHNYTPLKFVELPKKNSLFYISIYNSGLDVQTGRSDGAQTRANKVRNEQRRVTCSAEGTPKCGESETEVSCVCTSISTALVTHVPTHTCTQTTAVHCAHYTPEVGDDVSPLPSPHFSVCVRCTRRKLPVT